MAAQSNRRAEEDDGRSGAGGEEDSWSKGKEQQA